MYWNWKTGGIVLGLVFFLAPLIIKPIGVSTQFAVADGIVMKILKPGYVKADSEAESGYTSTNPYLASSGGELAKDVAHPLNYGYLFVLFMFVGGFIGRLFTLKKFKLDQVPPFHSERFGPSPGRRYFYAFLGGVIVLFGARLAGGCTSGHMMSGIMQTAISGFAFLISAFIIAVPLAILLYRKKGA